MPSLPCALYPTTPRRFLLSSRFCLTSFAAPLKEQFYGMWKIAFESSRLGGDLRRAKEVKK